MTDYETTWKPDCRFNAGPHLRGEVWAVAPGGFGRRAVYDAGSPR